MENEHRAPFEGLSEEQIKERLDAYERAKAEATEARKEFRVGIVDAPQVGKTYIHFQLPEGHLGRGFTFGDEERGGDVLRVKSGAFIEVDTKGMPMNPVLRELVEHGELDLSQFPKEKA